MLKMSGQSVKGYELRERIGAGGFGAVYKAYQPLVRRDVAIKVILPQYVNQPDFIRRFESEAQLIARLEHPFIVPLYDYWREPDGAYLVMRWLPGGSLRDKIKKGPMAVDAVSRVLDQIASGLAVAHRRGVVHRDIKPDNILLDEEHNAYLADFGIAKHQSISSPEATGIVAGSPAYLPPEQFTSEEPTAQGDIYSLGIMLFELLVGEVPYSDSSMSGMIYRKLNEPIPELDIKRPELAAHPILDTVLKRACALSPRDRYPDVSSLAEAFRQAANVAQVSDVLAPLGTGVWESSTSRDTTLLDLSGNTLILTDDLVLDESTTLIDIPVEKQIALENPYKGLRAFQEADAADFFGRASLVDQLVERLCEPHPFARFLAVVGPSGSGKSSVVKAGLIPRLRTGALPNSANWYYVEMAPGPSPLVELGTALRSIAVNPPGDLEQQLATDTAGLARLVNQIVPEGTELVLVIDQFEEVFTLLQDEPQRVHLMRALIQAVTDPNSRIRIIVTLRADFYDRPLMYPGFSDALRKRTEVVIPLTPEELRETILRPAQRVQLGLEAGLIDAIVGDVASQPGALPLLQYALTDLYETCKGHPLTLRAYREGGQVMGALARRADEIYHGLGDDGRESARQLLLRLVTLGEGVEDTRRRAQWAELPDDDETRRVIDVMARYRLLTIDRDPITRSPTVEVAHEALIRTWERLREWLQTSREDLRTQRRLAAAATEWQNAKRDPSFLASGARLEQFGEWSKKTTIALNRNETEYLRTSLAERDRQARAEEARKAREAATARLARNFQRVTAVLAIVGVLAVGAGIFAGVRASDAEQRVSLAAQTLTPVPQTLVAAQSTLSASNIRATEIARQVQRGERRIDALQIASSANLLLASDAGNAELAALLSISSLRTEYTYQAEAASWDAASRLASIRRYTGHSQGILAVAYSPDGKQILTGSADNTAILWDVQTGAQLRTFKGHTAIISGVAFSPDGKQILTGSADKTARLWDVQTGTEIRQFKGHTEAITAVSFSSDGKRVLTGSQDMTARLWDAQTGTEIRQFKGHTGKVNAAAMSSDGKRVLTGSDDKLAIWWNADTGEQIRAFREAKAPILAVAISANNKVAALSSADAYLSLWDATTDSVGFNLELSNDVIYGLAFSPDGSVLLGAGDNHSIVAFPGTLPTSEPQSEQAKTLRAPFSGHDGRVTSVAFSPDGKTFVSGSEDGTARLWRADMSSLFRETAPQPSELHGVSVSPDGKFLLTAGGDGEVQLWDAATLANVRTFSGHEDAVTAALFTPDGKRVFTTSWDKTARLWDAQTGAEIRKFEGHTDYILCAALSPDGKWAVTGSTDRTARVWDLESGQTLRTLTGHAGQINAVVVSSDGKRILTGSADKTARLWDAQTGALIQTLTLTDSEVTVVAFSPDAKLILAGSSNGTVQLWSADGSVVGQLSGHTGAVSAAVFSPDGKLILTGGADKTARLWDVQSRTEIRRFTRHGGPVLGAAFSPDGQALFTVGNDGMVHRWDTRLDDWITQVCGLVLRDYTTQERSQYALSGSQATCPQFAK